MCNARLRTLICFGILSFTQSNAREITQENLQFYQISVMRSFEVAELPQPKSPLSYETSYDNIKAEWKKVIQPGDLNSFFFSNAQENSELTDNAMQALMYRFLIDNPSIKMPDLNELGVFTLAAYDATQTPRAKTHDTQVNNMLLNPAIAAFGQGRDLYANIVQVGGANGGHYTVVAIQKNGKVHMINTFKPFPGDQKEEPYQYVLASLVQSLNGLKTNDDIAFSVGDNVRTGIQDPDIGSNSCGLYSLTYWAALLLTDDINAYQKITAAASDGKLTCYDDIKTAALYSKAIPTITQISKGVDLFGIMQYKNPNAEQQAEFEKDLREWLATELKKVAN